MAEKEEGDEIVTGSLVCPNCELSYVIADGIPNLLPPDKD